MIFEEQLVLVIELNDNGLGIFSDVLDYVFELFFMIKMKGIGLGLVIVKRLIDVYYGMIEILWFGLGGVWIRIIFFCVNG